MRVLLAFLIAPPVGASLFTAWLAIDDYIHAIHYDRINVFTFIAPLMIGGYPLALLVGVPIYFFFRNTGKSKIVMSMLAGAMIAGIPWLILHAILFLTSRASLAWLESMEETTLPAFVCGSGAGLSFWLIAR